MVEVVVDDGAEADGESVELDESDGAAPALPAPRSDAVPGTSPGVSSPGLDDPG
jgi:hypothetical protein